MQEAQRPQAPPRRFEVEEFDEKAIFLCQFCGGAACDQENYLTNKIQPNAIDGLHSNWITPDILAMQRPSERLIKEFNLYSKFKEENIRTVLNLQEPGEHPFCGDGIIPTVGFSYVPQKFFAHGIRCFNESWEDMTATTFEHMMKIMNLFDLTISEGGKMSVHCHAGRGRTLLVICSWLIYHDRMPAQDTIALAVAKRQGVLTRSSQRQFLVYFQQELVQRWRSYGVSAELQHTFTNFVEWQTGSLLSKDKKLLHKTPVAHFKLVSLVRQGIGKNKTKAIQSLLSPHSPLFGKTWTEAHEKQISVRKEEINKIDFTGLQAEEDLRILSELLFDFYDELPHTVITGITIECIQEVLHKNQKSPRLSILLDPAVVHDLGVCGLAVILDLCHLIASITASEDEGDERESEKAINAKVDDAIQEALFIKFSLIFLSKRKFFPGLFTTAPVRDCKIYKYISKIKKVVNSQVIFLATFLRQLAKQLPKELEDIHRIIFKACKVDSNLYYLTNQSPELLCRERKQQIYDNARIK